MRAESFFMVIVGIFALVIVVHSTPTGMAMKQPFSIFIPGGLDIRDLIIPGAGQAVQVEMPSAAGGVPDWNNLRPVNVEFYADSIMVPPVMNEYNFLPLKKDDMRTFSGKFGPYSEDYRKYFYVELCSYVLSQPEMFGCEKIRDLNFMDGYITFARGYDYDEFIAGLAMRNFGAYYVVQSTEFGPLATSNKAVINLV
ncbi:hypothetical protein KY338_03405 [Candidatus Woesearchaeota archaeon]|nr:hypothetical protein [Candidatus Woesearchaeota archaeon]MBW3005350.1 hypothetical protein [Candidatus Woesearchaeota archaeon]